MNISEKLKVTPWQTILLIIAAIGAVLYFMYRYVKATFTNNNDRIPLPELPINSAEIAPSFQAQAVGLAKEVYDAISGWFVSQRTKDTVYGKLQQLSNAELVYVYRVYNSKYFAEYNETMTQAINNELEVGFAYSPGRAVVSRLRTLGAS